MLRAWPRTRRRAQSARELAERFAAAAAGRRGDGDDRSHRPMIIGFQCARCSRLLKAPRAALGQGVRCSDGACGEVTRLPSRAVVESLPWLEAREEAPTPKR